MYNLIKCAIKWTNDAEVFNLQKREIILWYWFNQDLSLTMIVSMAAIDLILFLNFLNWFKTFESFDQNVFV